MPSDRKKRNSFVKSSRLSKAQIRNLPRLKKLYKIIHQYSLREEAYAVVLQAYLDVKKKIKKA